MKKIGILTRRAGFNHGSSLQAYAMYKLISSLGYNCQIINYDEYSGHKLWKVRPIIENIEYHCYKLCPFVSATQKFKYLTIRQKQISQFKLYEENYLHLSKEICRNKSQLLNIVQNYTTLVCGSDQIWSPLLYDPVFVFGFLNQNSTIKTIAYAPSIGVNNYNLISEEQKNYIKRIDYISCRENEGALLLERFLEKPVPVVLDPTLMVEKQVWIDMVNSVPVVEEEPYILCYFLGKNIPQKYIDNLKKTLGCKVLNIQMFNRLNNLVAERDITDLGPCHFLNLIANAKWVCTDSFHATIFSFLFHKRMSIFERFKTNQKDNQNSRIYTLLDSLRLKSVLTQDENIPNLNHSIDYEKSEECLRILQQDSLNFIKGALQ